MARAYPAVRALALVAAAALALTACGGDDDDEATPAASASSSTKVNTGNGVLKIGTLLPETGNLQILGPPEIAAVKLAIQDVNAAGGVLGKDVETDFSDSGDKTTDIASQSVNRLLDAGVDAIVGAASSSVTLKVVDRVTGSGVLMFSPAATSTLITDYPDKGLLWRTAPSDIFQGRVVGQTALDDGAETLGILALQDAYGTSLADQAETAFTSGGGEVVLKKIYDPTASEFSAEVGQVKKADPDAIALIGFEESSKLIDEMVKQGLLPLKSGKSLYLVDGNMSNASYANRAKGEMEGVKGTIPGSKPADDFVSKLKAFDPSLKDYSYAGEAYDAITLIALAAEAANSDAGIAIAKELQDVSTGGEKCGTFAECVKLLKENKDIDYEGQSGPVEFDSNGDPSVASMGIYQYGNDNMYKPLKFVRGPVAGGASTSESASSKPTSSSSAKPTSSTRPSPSPSPSPSSSPISSPTPGGSASPSATSTP
ncbi:ABC transporter substrate-binding protein [Sporichthya sp.]|uniref:ABC transporter substrate-binding protein n=1 Tax=Sporichthya sp. TaxID=65475 RepID=UPI001815CFFB|nr:ABC transporter substrate-binding protein [Sporichthya sp.]MBA3745569.1 ABC transporter substrate-binding protein [Sporichthya sp.]